MLCVSTMIISIKKNVHYWMMGKIKMDKNHYLKEWKEKMCNDVCTDFDKHDNAICITKTKTIVHIGLGCSGCPYEYKEN